jgi:hypothetical protein
MEENESIRVLEEGIDDESEELATCCKTGAPAKFQVAK